MFIDVDSFSFSSRTRAAGTSRPSVPPSPVPSPSPAPASVRAPTQPPTLSFVLSRPVAEVLRAVIVALREILHIKPLNEKALFGHYAQAALIVDAMIKEGIPELLDIPSIVQALSFDFPTLKEAIKGGTTSDEAEETA